MYLIKNKKGIVFIEVIIAFVVLLILLLPTLNIIGFCTNNYMLAGQRTQMVRAAEGIIEKIIAQKSCLVQNKSGLSIQGFPEFSYDLTISQFRKNKNLREIMLAIYPKNNPDKKVVFSTVRLVEE